MWHQVVNCIEADHHFNLVVLALSICLIATSMTLWMLHRAWSTSDGGGFRIWGIWGASVFAIGVWATHFVSMVGYSPIHDVKFDGGATLLSAVLAIAGITLSAIVMGRGQSVARRAVSGVMAAATVSVMHYVGMDALRGTALLEYQQPYISLSVVLVSVLFAIAFAFLLVPQRARRLVLAIPVIAGGVACLHYVSMSGLQVLPIEGLNPILLPITKSTLGSLVAIVSILVMLATVAGEAFFSVISQQASREHERLMILSDLALEGIVISRAGIVTEVNEALCQLIGAGKDEVIQKPVSELLQGVMSSDCLACENHGFCPATLVSISGEEIPVEISRRTFERYHDLEMFAVRDLRAQLAQRKEMHDLAFTDACTGAPNRRSFLRSLTMQLSKANSGTILVGLVDLDRFKDINDRYGHGAGDEVLKHVAQALRQAIRHDEVVARIAGDEFGLILGPFIDKTETVDAADRVIAALCGSVTIDGNTFEIGGSLGLTRLEAVDQPVDEILLNADRALYAAKESGRGNWRIYDQQLKAAYSRKNQIELALRGALARNEFELHFQPEVSTRTGKVNGYEALIRWRRNNDVLTLPGEFLQIAEDTGIICEIGEWSLMTACQIAAEWPDGQFVAVNVSARQVIEMELLEIVDRALARSGLAPSRLQIEVTETALFQNSRMTKEVLEALRERGVSVALDDFGTGYSSVSHLHSFPVDVIKIDRMFVSNLATDRKSQAIVDAVSRLANHLGIDVVAEGVETQEQADLLSSQGCHLLQGHLFGKPQPAEKLGNRNGRSLFVAA